LATHASQQNLREVFIKDGMNECRRKIMEPNSGQNMEACAISLIENALCWLCGNLIVVLLIFHNNERQWSKRGLH
jgi:hypothetical protein